MVGIMNWPPMLFGLAFVYAGMELEESHTIRQMLMDTWQGWLIMGIAAVIFKLQKIHELIDKKGDAGADK